MSHLVVRFTYLDGGFAVAVLVLIALLASAALYWRSWRSRPSWTPIALAALRFGAIVLALLLLLRPVVSYDRIRRGDGRVAVLIDRSRSMGTADSVLGEPRFASASRAATGEALERLDRVLRVERWTFSGPGTVEAWSAAASGSTAAAIAADGPTTDIASAWKDLPAGDGRLEAIVLFSDGRDHGRWLLDRQALSPEALPPAPVHTVGLGSGAGAIVDAGWVRATCERRVLRGSKVEVRGRVRLRGTGSSAARLTARLGSTTVASREVRLAEGPNDLTLDLVPDRAGSLVYALAIEMAQPDAIPANDATHVLVDVTDKPVQVLYIEGRARWQYKFVRAALDADPRLNVTGIVQLGAGRRLEQGRPPLELDRNLPSSREAWKRFDVLIVGNIVPEELAPEDPRRILQWIGEDGGGLVLVGGPESLPGLAATELDELFPISAAAVDRISRELSIRPALASMDHPIVRGLDPFFAPGRPGGPFGLPEGFRTGRARAGSEALLMMAPAPTDGDEDADEGSGAGADPEDPSATADAGAPPADEALVLLATRQYGKGRVLAWLTESDWRWRTERMEDGGDRLLATLWGRMVRWAARRDETDGDGPTIRLGREIAKVGQEVGVEVDGVPEGPPPSVAVSLPGGERRRVPLQRPSEGRSPEPWKGRFAAFAEGLHTVELEGPASGAPPATLVVEPDARELEDVSPDWDLLRRISDDTGGRFFTLPEAGSVADAIVRETKGAVQHVELGFDRSWTLYLALVGLLSLEWILRRRVHVV